MVWYGMVWGGNRSVLGRGQWDGRKGGRVERMAEEEGGRREEGRGGKDGREDGRDWCCCLDVWCTL